MGPFQRLPTEVRCYWQLSKGPCQGGIALRGTMHLPKGDQLISVLLPPRGEGSLNYLRTEFIRVVVENRIE